MGAAARLTTDLADAERYEAWAHLALTAAQTPYDRRTDAAALVTYWGEAALADAQQQYDAARAATTAARAALESATKSSPNKAGSSRAGG